MKLPFQTALITGSSRGIGRGIAVKLARKGVKKIAVHSLTRQDEAEKTLAQLRDAGVDGVLVQGDTSNASRAEELVHEAVQKLGGCDSFVQSVIPRL
jgi:NAD(P)-dependent dehydrogenase (short-subunit alcohol dehydrogenase family)